MRRTVRATLLALALHLVLGGQAGAGAKGRGPRGAKAQEPPPPSIQGYHVVAEYPHDGNAFTQGGGGWAHPA
jgi:hypothetical protein